VCGSFWRVETIQNGGRCHGNQGAKNVKFTPNSQSFTVMFPVTSTSSRKKRNPYYFLNPLFFVSMATAAKIVQPIPIFWAYLVPLDVDVVPIKFHQFLFVPTMFHEV
jgi:hypothetical protein